MLFSYRVKNELARMVPRSFLEQKDELRAILKLKGNIIRNEQEVKISIILENPSITRTVYNLIKKVFKIIPIIKKEHLSEKRKNYVVIIPFLHRSKKYFSELDTSWEDSFTKFFKEKKMNIDSLFSKEAYLRGAFLASGFVSNPEKMYHLEISDNNEGIISFILDLLNFFNLNPHMSFWKKKWVVYLKKGDSIFEFLRLIGVQNALLYFQDIRARKDVVNTVNRLVNCETANLDKTVLSAAKQLYSIDIIEKKIGLQNVPSKLAIIAKTRKKLPYASLQELAEEVDFEITKSGIYHRLKKISQIADSLLEN